MKLTDYVVAKRFFPTYCAGIRSWQHKLRGRNGRGNPMTFSDQDRKVIRRGLDNLIADLKNNATNPILSPDGPGHHKANDK
jgi:hypothetical protein